MHSRNLNFGCGKRFAAEWVNIDFDSDGSAVQRVNLLTGFPFPDSSFDAVYSSHVLEHFDRRAASFLLSESKRVLKQGGILRIVVPDLEATCVEYMRILNLPDGREKRKLYSWIIIELLDQMVRMKPGGEMASFKQEVMEGDDDGFKTYIRMRTGSAPRQGSTSSTFHTKLQSMNLQKLATKLSYWYINAISMLVPTSLRRMIFVATDIGERHRWMYDEYGLKLLFEEAGLNNITRLSYDYSQIPRFNSFCLDCEQDGRPYKRNSIYLEASK